MRNLIGISVLIVATFGVAKGDSYWTDWGSVDRPKQFACIQDRSLKSCQEACDQGGCGFEAWNAYRQAKGQSRTQALRELNEALRDIHPIPGGLEVTQARCFSTLR